jgi:hypothetical protein
MNDDVSLGVFGRTARISTVGDRLPFALHPRPYLRPPRTGMPSEDTTAEGMFQLTSAHREESRSQRFLRRLT